MIILPTTLKQSYIMPACLLSELQCVRPGLVSAWHNTEGRACNSCLFGNMRDVKRSFCMQLGWGSNEPCHLSHKSFESLGSALKLPCFRQALHSCTGSSQWFTNVRCGKLVDLGSEPVTMVCRLSGKGGVQKTVHSQNPPLSGSGSPEV